MKSTTAIFTVVHNGAIPFLDDYFTCLINQTDKEFEILLVNDGIDSIDSIIKNVRLNINVFNVNFSFAKNREKALFYAKEKYEKLIFLDSDDYCDSSRVEKTKHLLDTYNIVVSDLTLVNSVGDILQDNVFSDALKNGDLIDERFIFKKNIFGFSNTAIKTDIIPNNLNLINELVAVDWSFFSIILNKGYKAYYTNGFDTFYRQYENNLIGLKQLNVEKLYRGIDVKIAHLNCLKANGIKTSENAQQYVDLKLSLQLDKLELEKYLNNATQIVQKSVFWWEQIKLLKDYENTVN